MWRRGLFASCSLRRRTHPRDVAAAVSGALLQRLDAKEQVAARSYNDDLVKRYKSHVKDDEAVSDLDRRIALIDREFDVDAATGEVRETRALQRESAIYGLVRETEAERLRRCLCDAMLPRCPTPGKPPFLVPITCLTGVTEGNKNRA